MKYSREVQEIVDNLKPGVILFSPSLENVTRLIFSDFHDIRDNIYMIKRALGVSDCLILDEKGDIPNADEFGTSSQINDLNYLANWAREIRGDVRAIEDQVRITVGEKQPLI